MCYAELRALLTSCAALITFILFIVFVQLWTFHDLIFYLTTLQVYHIFRSHSRAKNRESQSFQIHQRVALLISSIFICLETLPSIRIYDSYRA